MIRVSVVSTLKSLLISSFLHLQHPTLPSYLYLCRFGCPSLLPKSPFTSTFPVPLRDVRVINYSESTSSAVTVTVKDGKSISEDSCSVNNGDTSHVGNSSVGCYNGIVSMYRGMTNTDLWTTKVNSSAASGEGQGQG